MNLKIKTIKSLYAVSANEWNAIAGQDFPFIQYEFLVALENNGAVGKEFGWITNFFLAYNGETLVGALPLYIKFNSYGEFILLYTYW